MRRTIESLRDILPTQGPLDEIIAVHEGKQLAHVGFIGRMKFQSASSVTEEFHRIDYAKYVSGEKDFYFTQGCSREA